MRLTAVAVLLLATLALAGCSGASKDSDDDLLYDSVEKRGWTIQVDLMTERIERHVRPDPHLQDTDGDGLGDGQEFQVPGLDPTRADTDGDGLTDCQEVRHTVVAECLDPNFAGPYDGGYGTNGAKADSDPGYSRYRNTVVGFVDHTGSLANGLADTGDGISDGEEVAGYEVLLGSGARRTIHTNPMNGDEDDDGLDDGEERFVYASDPTVPDSDGDGCIDGLDLWPERSEVYRAGLGEFVLKQAANANLQVYALVANYGANTPVAGTIQARPGEPVDLAPYEGPGGRGDCTYTPYDPWVLVEVQAFDKQPAGVRWIDIASQTPTARSSGEAARFYWDVRGDRLSWDPEGAESWAGADGVTLEGAGGRVQVRPTVV